MRVAFAGTPPFAVRALEALHQAGHDVVLVLSQPDRPAGRGMKISPSAVSSWAIDHGLPLHRPDTLKSPESRQLLLAAPPDVMVVAAYGLLLPPEVLAIPRHGCLNIHASLLPRWRGAAPVQRAILAGDASTGVGIMQMEAGLDTGPVLLERTTPIMDDDTAGSLTERLATMGAEAIVEALGRLTALVPRKQGPEGVTYAAKITKGEAKIDWSSPAPEVVRRVRAFNPIPGAETTFEGAPLKVWEAEVGDPAAESGHEPGRVVEVSAHSFEVACGTGTVRVKMVQRAGSRRVSAGEFARGHPVESGVLGRADPV